MLGSGVLDEVAGWERADERLGSTAVARLSSVGKVRS